MLKNYFKDNLGIIHQKKINIIHKDYGQQYNNYGEKSNYLSYLRLGFIYGAIKEKKIDSILDIGIGNGDFLKACNEIIENCYGYDLTYKYLPPSCKIGNLYNKYDIITMYDSLEHFEDISFINNLNCKYLVISIPNCKFGDNDEWFLNWKHRKENEHLHHMDINSLVNFAKNYTMINYSYIEDVIRKDVEEKNILTIVFKKGKI